MPLQPTVLDEHLARFDDAQRAALRATADTIARALPGAVVVIAYGMPTFKLGDGSGPAVMGLDGFARHNSLFPYSGLVLERFATELGDRRAAKGTIHFERDRPFPAGLLRRILRTRLQEINAGYPTRAGEYRQYHANGFLKVRGRQRDGVRRGTWTTYDRAGVATRIVEY